MMTARLLLLMVLGAAAGFPQNVRVWQDAASLPTYFEGPPDTTPTFEVLFGENTVYPYTMRPNFTDRRGVESWRIVHLENEYLHCRIFPDLGGHLYGCVNKIDNRELFYANSAIRKLGVGPRGAWVELGIEANFPVGHSRVAVSPVDFALRENADHSASAWVATIDRVSGMQWRVEFLLRPGVAALEENVYLYNRTSGVHNYYWWNNAALTLQDPDTRFVFPARLASTHEGFVETWPVNSAGKDIAATKSHDDMFAMFAYGCNEPFMGVYEPATKTGIVHLADPKSLPGKKAWDWGSRNDPDAHKRAADDGSKSIEMQAGTQQNQETASFLGPAEALRFTEVWIPVHGLGGITRATNDAVLNLERRGSQLIAELNVARAIRGARIAVRQDDRTLYEEQVDLDPARVYRHTVDSVSPRECAFILTDASGRALLSHSENHYDALDTSAVKLGVQPSVPGPPETSEEHFFLAGNEHEKEGLLWAAHEDYRGGLKRFPESGRLHLVIGKVALNLSRFEEALAELQAAQSRLPETPELHFYLGRAQAALGNTAAARKDWEAIRSDSRFGVPTAVELGGLLARTGEWKDALASFRYAAEHGQEQVRAGSYEVAVLRRLGDADGAKTRLAHWLALDPTSSFLRAQAVSLGAADGRLGEDLAADPERILDIADDYLFLSLCPEALPWLERAYPSVPANRMEAGGLAPQAHPLIAYYRGYCRQQAGQSPEKDFQAASSQSARGVFPYRPSSFAVLKAALAANAKDALAHLLLGYLLMNQGQVDPAVQEWQTARSIRLDLPGVNIILGRTLLDLQKKPADALAVLKDALGTDPGDTMLHTYLDRALGQIGVAPAQLAPKDLARVALMRAGMGREDALGAFSAANFPTKQKQEDEVRATYIELRLQRVVIVARAHRCEPIPELLSTLDAEGSLPLTSGGFGSFTKTPRFQYYLGVIEAACGDEKTANKRWAKIKPVAEISSPDYTFPLLASLRLKAPAAKTELEGALAKMEQAVASAPEGSRGMLLFQEGMLLRASGKEPEAQARFEAGLQAPAAGWSQYLNLLALHEPAQ